MDLGRDSVGILDGNPGGGAACDGLDDDLCENGLVTCLSPALACVEDGPGFVEICENGIDDDCDLTTDELDCTPP